MKLRDILHLNQVKIFAIIILVLLGTGFFLYHFVFPSNPAKLFLSALDNSYLLLIEKFAGQLLHLTGSNLTIENHFAFLNSIQLNGFHPETLYKKWGLILLLIIWLTRTSFLKRLLFTLLIFFTNFVLVSVDVALRAHLASLEYFNRPVSSLSLTIGTLIMASLLFLWYWKNKAIILNSLSNLKIGANILKNKLPTIIIITFIYIITATFLVDYFDFGLWIDILFTSSQKILSLIGYKATVEPFNLIGDNGSIYMAKGCLGINTMLLFASIVYLTGTDNKRRWFYIISGILFLNFINVMRFVLLFIHIQKNGGYVLAMDVHDIFNYITYSIVFALWVVWFEKFSDIKPLNKEKTDQHS